MIYYLGNDKVTGICCQKQYPDGNYLNWQFLIWNSLKWLHSLLFSLGFELLTIATSKHLPFQTGSGKTGCVWKDLRCCVCVCVCGNNEKMHTQPWIHPSVCLSEREIEWEGGGERKRDLLEQVMRKKHDIFKEPQRCICHSAFSHAHFDKVRELSVDNPDYTHARTQTRRTASGART